MSVETLRPNAAGDAAAHSVYAAANNFIALSDDTDTTYIRNNTGSTLEDDVGLDDVSLIADSIDSINIRFRARSETTANGSVTVGLRLNGVNSMASAHTSIPVTVTDYEDLAIARPGGGSWAESDLNSLQVVIQSNDGSAAGVRVFEIFIDINYTATGGAEPGEPGETASITSAIRIRKKYFFKVYKSTGKYVNSWSDASFDSFKKTINGGLGECRIKLARPFDDFGEDNDVRLNNKVEIYCSDKETAPEGIKIYSGFISNYSPFIDGSNEGVEVICLGYVSKLATSILRDNTFIELHTTDVDAGGLTKYLGDRDAWEVRKVVLSIIDLYQANSLNPIINYSATSTEDSGNTFTYTFNARKYNEALNICQRYAPANWWWYVGADNIIKFKPKPNKADHKFVFGKHFKSIKVEKNMENVVNRVLFSNGDNADQQILKIYQDADSSDDYDDRWEVITDNRVSVSETADNMGQSTLAEKKDADVKTTIEILDSNGNPDGYDIESINPGDTCKFLNLNTITSQTFSENMVIKAVDYAPDKVIIEVESLKVSVGKELIESRKRIESGEASGRATSYDTDTDGWREIGGSGEPSFENGWINYGGGFNTCAFRKDSQGFVHLKGMTKSGTDDSVIFTLPAGYRPAATELFASRSNLNAGYLQVSTAGAVQGAFGTVVWITLDGIVFKAT